MISMSQHEELLRRALVLSASCRGVRYYGVGCLICASDGQVVASGYTGEIAYADSLGTSLPHAEETAILKARREGKHLQGCTLYSTLEPCSQRKSGRTACVDLILETGISRVVYGAREPFDPELGIVCRGHARLAGAGLEVIHLAGLEQECLRAVKAAGK